MGNMFVCATQCPSLLVYKSNVAWILPVMNYKGKETSLWLSPTSPVPQGL